MFPHHLADGLARAGSRGFASIAKRNGGYQFALLAQPVAQLFVGDEHVTDPQRSHPKLLGGKEHILDGGSDGLDIEYVLARVASHRG
jgi:hypothetical protein